MHVKSKLSLLLLTLAVSCAHPWTVYATSDNSPEDIPEDTTADQGDTGDSEIPFPSDSSEDIPDDSPDSPEPDEVEEETPKASEEEPAEPEEETTQEGDPTDEPEKDTPKEDSTEAEDTRPETDMEGETDDPADKPETDTAEPSEKKTPSDNPEGTEEAGEPEDILNDPPAEDDPLSLEEDTPGLAAGEEEPVTDYFFEKDFTEYTVTEGLLLLIFCTLFCKLCIDLTAKLNHWRMY